MNREAALVVFSGGQDSTTCLFWAKRNFKKVYALSFLYGQKHQKEVELAREIARKAERSRSETLEALKQKTQFSPNTEMREQQLTEIFTSAQNSAWDTIRNCVNWLIAEVRSRKTIAELSTITLSMMTAA